VVVCKNNIECIRCENCNKWRELSHFLKRENRAGYYAFCDDCMTEMCREPGYPAFNKRGGGSLELEPRD